MEYLCISRAKFLKKPEFDISVRNCVHCSDYTIYPACVSCDATVYKDDNNISISKCKRSCGVAN